MLVRPCARSMVLTLLSRSIYFVFVGVVSLTLHATDAGCSGNKCCKDADCGSAKFCPGAGVAAVCSCDDGGAMAGAENFVNDVFDSKKVNVRWTGTCRDRYEGAANSA